MQHLFLFLICFCLHYHSQGQELYLLNELKTKGLYYKIGNNDAIAITISKDTELYIESDTILRKTTISLGGKKDILEQYIENKQFLGAYKSSLHTKNKDFIILEILPKPYNGIIETFIIELKNNKVYKVFYFNTFGYSLENIKVRDKKLYVYIFEIDVFTKEYLGINNVTFSVTTFELDEKEGLVYRETEFNGCYILLDNRSLLKIYCPFDYRPVAKPIIFHYSPKEKK
ncbi:MAG: hypothetical protein EAZ55_00095 [Cytophagales bacterium]|nr:MAG: hypothetical protein EAZ55_00095 [Cytophagales bacterium]